MNYDEISATLNDAGLQFRELRNDNAWAFEIMFEGTHHSVFLISPPPGISYLVITAPIEVEPLREIDIEQIKAPILRKLFRLQAESPLAKIEYMAVPKNFYVVSNCARDKIDGVKLRRRIEACARLAIRVEQEFSS